MASATAADPQALIWEAGHHDPAWRSQNLFGIPLVSYQRKILQSVRDHERTAVASAHGVGKTLTAAVAVLDFLSEGPGRVITTAPTWSQVEDLLWREIHKGYHAASRNGLPFGGRLMKTRIEISEDWFAVGLSTDQPERFQGHHADRLLLVVDEASGVDDDIFQAARGFMTGAHARTLLIGNPTRLVGQFYRAFTAEAALWNTFRISAFDCPAITGEACDDATRRALVQPKWIDEMRETYGEEHPVYLIRVKGEFALTTGRGYFNPSHLATLEPTPPTLIGQILGDPVPGGQIQFQSTGDGPLTIWERRQTGKTYAIFADIAGGVSVDVEEARPPKQGGDYSCAQVVCLQTGAQVAELRLRCDEAAYAMELARLGWWYNHAEICPENTGGYGTATITLLRDRYGYSKIFRREGVTTVTRDVTERYGWDTNTTTRPQMLAELARVLREDPSRIRGQGVIDEMRTFVWNKTGTKAQADIGSFDDRVVALAGAFRLYTLRCEAPITIGQRSYAPPAPSISQRAIGQLRSTPKARPAALEDMPAKYGRIPHAGRLVSISRKAQKEHT